MIPSGIAIGGVRRYRKDDHWIDLHFDREVFCGKKHWYFAEKSKHQPTIEYFTRVLTAAVIHGGGTETKEVQNAVIAAKFLDELLPMLALVPQGGADVCLGEKVETTTIDMAAMVMEEVKRNQVSDVFREIFREKTKKRERLESLLEAAKEICGKNVRLHAGRSGRQVWLRPEKRKKEKIKERINGSMGKKRSSSVYPYGRRLRRQAMENNCCPSPNRQGWGFSVSTPTISTTTGALSPLS